MPNPIPDARPPVLSSIGTEAGTKFDPRGASYQQLYVETLDLFPLGGAPPVDPVVVREGKAETILLKDEA